MVALRGTEIELVPLAKAVARLKTVTRSRLAETGGLHRLTPPAAASAQVTPGTSDPVACAAAG